jgi:hypothetical protein
LFLRTFLTFNLKPQQRHPKGAKMALNEQTKRAAFIGLFLLAIAGIRWYNSQPATSVRKPERLPDLDLTISPPVVPSPRVARQLPGLPKVQPPPPNGPPLSVNSQFGTPIPDYSKLTADLKAERERERKRLERLEKEREDQRRRDNYAAEQIRRDQQTIAGQAERKRLDLQAEQSRERQRQLNSQLEQKRRERRP